MSILSLSNVRSEGGLLPVDVLQRIVSRDRELPGMYPKLTQGDPAESVERERNPWNLSGGERLTDAINRSWQKMLAVWRRFAELRDHLPEGDPGTRLTREELLLPLFAELGYGRLVAARPEDRLVRHAGTTPDSQEKSWPISHFWLHSPIHLVGCGVDMDRRTRGIAGAAQSSPHSLVQEFLNRSDAHLWGFVSNGLILRILRDNASLSRQAFVEFDLQGLFNGESFADFALLWMLCHESRVEAEKPENCWLEQWMQEGRNAAVLALDSLRNAVQQAIVALGQGFMDSRNPALRESLSSGDLNRQEYFRQLLRLVYRIIFLFVLEDRRMLHGPEATPASREHYLHSYSLSRLRKLAASIPGGTHGDLYEGLKLVMDRLESRGCPELGLAPLGGFLWSDKALPDIAACSLRNTDLLKAIRELAFTVRDWRRRPVDFRHLGARELGSVYESLLELHPVVENGEFRLDVAAGNERKTTGSYYTPTRLIDSLLDSALEPVINQTISRTMRDAGSVEAAETALLNLKICDPACGSGHFLLAAAQRLAKRLAALRSGDEEPAPAVLRHALRDVIGRCVYGVDLNPMSVELCKVSLWLEAVEPGKPLSFLDHHIQCGNSLLGTTRQCILNGLPEEAFEALAGDDKKACTALRKKNRNYLEGVFGALGRRKPEAWQNLLAEQWRKDFESLMNLAAPPDLDAMPANTIAELEAQEKAYHDWMGSGDWKRKKLLFDMWCAAFVAPRYFPELEKYPGVFDDTPIGISSGTIQDFASGRQESRSAQSLARQMAGQYQFFHLAVSFPEVEARGGFDVVLGNPPWERIKLQEKEWFAAIRPDIAEARNAAARKKMIAALKKDNPALYAAYTQALRDVDGQSHFLRNSGRFPFCGRGDINLYTVFAENMRNMLNDGGRLGCIVPSGIATDDTTKFFFQNLVETQSLVSLYDFENKGIFPGVHASYKFSLLTAGSGAKPLARQAQFVFFAHSTDELRDPQKRFTLSPADIALLNPNTRTCPIFRSSRDAELTKAVYRRVPVLIREARDGRPEENPWGVKFNRMFDMSNDSRLFRTREELEDDGWLLAGNVFEKAGKNCLPLYEAKMIHHFTHRWATYRPGRDAAPETRDVTLEELQNPHFCVQPRYWVAEEEVRRYLAAMGWKHGWLMGWRDITNATNERTVVSGFIQKSAVADTYLLLFGNHTLKYLIPCCLNSYVCDYITRQKIGGVHLKFHYFRQLPVLPPAAFYSPAPWQPSLSLAEWLRPRILELSYTAEDMRPFAEDLGFHGDPFAWDEARRAELRAELDAAFFHLYLPANSDGTWKQAEKETAAEYKTLCAAFPTPRHAVDYIMETFPIVKKKDEKAYGGYRTKEAILREYDGMMNQN
ncbi:N-6 DNA methylase [uncultured Mailhella sp.]|uniref:Eco57I restriction-modification methylase domain-containing protein n=1 Tax=uncultured Mailhella sp. TaxID=1981031 RepID=UPI0026376A78|nr:N-6 DNA methylase [uncultured Mailhella sp.]